MMRPSSGPAGCSTPGRGYHGTAVSQIAACLGIRTPC
jgi:hypothetical protein